ncbi:MAG: NADH-quinone oxidoreductase subunit M [Thermotogae bacterium]|nr:NADH-quinone oxidoreductase subunit M [Thermotogota bacterium]
MLSLVIFFPLVAAIPLFFLNPEWRKTYWVYATFVSFVEFLFSLVLLFGFDFTRAGEFQFVERYVLLGLESAPYYVGIDGLALILILLTTFLTFLGIVSSYNYIREKVQAYVITMLMLETAMIGVFASLNLVQFFIFWEAQLIPMFILIALWGHENRVYAAFKFLIYTAVGSVPMLAAIIWIYLNYGTFDYPLLAQVLPEAAIDAQKLLFLAFSLGFMIKVPMFPFHTWLPDAHVEAPTAGSVILAGILLKMGTFGFLRYSLPLFPMGFEAFRGLIAALAIIGIIYGGLMAWVQSDMKKLVAYSSVAHMGFAMLGIASGNPIGIQGAILVMISHGLTTGALFFIVGMLYERRHTRLIRDYSGIANKVPNLSTFFGFMALASIGLPGLSGFVGEFLSMIGAYKANPLWGYLAVPGVIVAAMYMLSLIKRVVFGKLDEESAKMPDLSFREALILLSLAVFVVWIGIYPSPFLSFTDQVSNLIATLLK